VPAEELLSPDVPAAAEEVLLEVERSSSRTMQPQLLGLTRVLAASAADAERFAAFGVAAERIEVTGNLKLDANPPELSPEERAQLRRELGVGDAPLLLGASTWPGEEEALLAAWRGVGAAGWKLLLVPRHAERRGEVEALLAATGVRYHLRSRGPALAEVDVAASAVTTADRKALTKHAALAATARTELETALVHVREQAARLGS
jgi:3-deoxy-D-manno-octulosonic-acid transferase